VYLVIQLNLKELAITVVIADVRVTATAITAATATVIAAKRDC